MSAFADVVIDREAVSQALLELGVDLTHSLAPSVVLGATDVLLALELARRNPFEGNFDQVLDQLHSFSQAEPLPARVVGAMRQVMDAGTGELEVSSFNQDSLAVLRRRISVIAA